MKLLSESICVQIYLIIYKIYIFCLCIVFLYLLCFYNVGIYYIVVQ